MKNRSIQATYSTKNIQITKQWGTILLNIWE